MRKIFFTIVLISACFISQAQINDAFFTPHVTQSGAFNYDNWTEGWANFDPQNTVYPTTTVTKSGHITTDETWNSSASPVNTAAAFTDDYLNDPFFDQTTFVGAFGPDDWTANWANFNPNTTVYPTPNVSIPGGDLTTQTWTNGNTYLLNGKVYVPDGVTLTIQAGTVIRGDKNNEGTLVVERGGKIIAEGTETAPIVFTSNQGINSRTYGDWGGVIICGKALNNQGPNVQIEGLEDPVYYGGTDDHDNSGILKYVRIEFCGIALTPNNEINGLTMGSVGDSTFIDYVQVSYSGDDAFEWFGGTVNAKHLIALRAYDDDFDTDFGFTGKVQFAVSLRDPAVADISGSNGFESDNDGAGSTNIPLTQPIFCNVSIFGPKVTSGTTINSNYKRALHLKKNTRCSAFNSIFLGYPVGLLIEAANTQSNATNDIIRIENSFQSGMVSTNETSSPEYDENAYFTAPARNNQIFTNNTELLITDPFNLTNPNFLPSRIVYLLEGNVYVDSLVTLNIQAGTIIRGDKNTEGTLVVKRGAKIYAIGTETQPIVFTSNFGPGARAMGDWGGVILLGKAVNNQGIKIQIEGLSDPVFYGGTDNNDNSGILKYVRIEFCGIALSPNNEINGLTMGSVGKNTEIDYVQVSYCGDDSFEWFGGNVNCKHLISYRGLDDDFDTDFGFTGKVHYGVGLRDPAQADGSGANAFESSNDGSGSGTTPITHPFFSNISVFGPLATPSTPYDSDFKRALHLNKNTQFSIHNSLFEGFPTGLDIDGAAAEAQFTNGFDTITNCFMSGMTTNYAAGVEQAFWEDPDNDNTTYANNSSMMITDPFNLTNPNFMPMNGSPVQFGSLWVKTIQGKILYDNAIGPKTQLNNVTVTCMDNTGKLVSTAVTNSSGDYTLKAVDGIFDISVSCPIPWGGVLGSDVVRIRQALVGPPDYLTDLQEIASDVNLSGTLSGSDVIAIRQRLVDIEAPQWKAPDWIFEEAQIVITPGAGVTTKDIYGLCGGDANGSYVPTVE
jgi:hypothetical protein